MDTIKLAQKLISIPSYVDGQTDERKIGEFIYAYLRQFKWLEIKKQPVTNGRFNIVAKDKYPTRLLLIGHMDTVQPKTGWETNQLKAVVKNRKIYGLGAADMKGSLAVILSALSNFRETKGLMILFYIDEEYDFLGTKKFLKGYQIKPKLIVSGDGGNLKVGRSCRGLIEISLVVQGQTGHAANPDVGKNAIDLAFAAVDDLRNYFKTTINLAFFQGGLNLGRTPGNQLVLGREGNNIADIAELIVDIRPATAKITAEKIIKRAAVFLKAKGVKLLEAKTRHDLTCWLTKKKEIKSVIAIIDKETPVIFSGPDSRGFIDIQMFWRAFDKVPCLSFGVGEESLAHKPNEFVQISELKKAEKVYQEIIRQLCRQI